MRYGGTALEAGLLPDVGGVLGGEVLAPIGDGVPVPVGRIPLSPRGKVGAGCLRAAGPVESDGVSLGRGVIPTPEMFGCVAVVLGDGVLVEPPWGVDSAAGFGPVLDAAGVAWSLLPEPRGINGVPVPPLSVALVRTIDGEAGEETELVDGLGPDPIGFGIVEPEVAGQVEEVDLFSFLLGLERGV